MHQERYISEKVAAMWNYPTRSSAVAGNPTRPICASACRNLNEEVVDQPNVYYQSVGSKLNVADRKSVV